MRHRLTLWMLCCVGIAGLGGCGSGEPPGDIPVGGEVTVHDPDRAWPSYMLYSGVHKGGAYLIDMEANVVHTWEADHEARIWENIELQDDGSVITVTSGSDGLGDNVLDVSWDGEIVQILDQPAHHDVHRLDNGNTVILGREWVENQEIFHDTLKSDYFAEVTPGDEVLWAWHADEHASKLGDFVDVIFPVSQEDWAHTNSVEILPDTPAGDADSRFRAGNLLFSYCNLDIIGVIDMDSMALVWAWGPGVLEGQHMPTMLDNGHLLIYDNGSTRGWTRIVEMDPVTEEIVWTYQGGLFEDLYSDIYGSAQRLPNGNTYIADPLGGRALEVTTEGDIVWEWHTWEEYEGEAMPLYRTFKYDVDLVDGLL